MVRTLADKLEFKEKIVSRVKEIREELNIAQQDLAEAVGVSRQTIYYLEKGTYNPKLTLGFKIAEKLKKPINEIFFTEPLIKEALATATLEQARKISESLNIEIQELDQLRDLQPDKLLNRFTKEEWVKITEVLKYNFNDLFIVIENPIKEN